MNRRAFISLLGGGAAAWPLAARAQTDHVRRIGVLMNKAADDAEARSEVSAFVGALQERGWTLGGNLQIDYRWGAGDADRYRTYAAELVAHAPDLLLAVGGTVRPKALAVLRLMISSTLVACWTGKSAGFSPLRMRPV